jgi:aminobenzoyl-glutamate utilization protein B
MIGSLTILLACVLPTADATSDWSAGKRTTLTTIDQQTPLIETLAQKIWAFAEPAFQEFQSSKLLADTLEQNGFRVRRNVAGMKTAFIAEYGSGKPVVALLAEYDALPGLAQGAVPRQEPIAGSRAGHGCGHNLFGAACVGAALAVREAMEQQKLGGTLRVYGCPAEEGGSGKVYLVRAGTMDDVDVAIHWHPGTKNSAAMKTSLAVIRFRAHFEGKAAHAAGSPHQGRSALDAVELMNVGTNYLREHVPSDSRIHYVITSGGRRPNVVPDQAESWYYIRAPKMSQAQEIFERVKKIAQGAALMTETKSQVHRITGSYEILENEPLARQMDANFHAIGVPQFSAAELEFATQLRKELSLRDTGESSAPVETSIAKFGYESGEGSTDVGDVSWVVPTVGLNVVTAAKATPGHSWGLVACSGSPLGKRGAITAAKVLAATAFDLFEKPALVSEAKADFNRRKGSVVYRAILDDGPPPERLDDF